MKHNQFTTILIHFLLYFLCFYSELGRINYKKHEIMCATKQTHAVFSTLQPKDFVYVSGHLQYIVKFNKDLNRSVVQTSTMPHLIVRLSK